MAFDRETSRRLTLKAGLLLLVLGIAAIAAAFPRCSVETIDIVGVRARLYLPPGERVHDRSGVLLLRGVASTKEIMDEYGIQLATAGCVALSPEFPSDDGDEQYETARAAYEELARWSTPRGILGYSMGGYVAANLGWRVRTLATATTGMYVNGDLRVDYQNFMVATGAFDTLHPPPAVLTSLRSFTGDAQARPGVLYGSFEARNARMMFVSPFSDHGAEAVDPALLLALPGFLLRAFHEDPSRLPDRIILASMGWAAVLGGLFLLVPRWLCWGVAALGVSRRTASAVALVVSLASGVSACAGVLDGGAAAGLAMVLACGTAIGMHLTRPGAAPGYPIKWFAPALMRAAPWLGGLLLGFSASQLLYEWPIVLREGVRLTDLPTHLWVTYVLAPGHLVASWTRAAFDHALARWLVVLLFALLPLLETLSPGLLGRLVAPRPLRLAAGGFSPATVTLLVLLLAGCALAWLSVLRADPSLAARLGPFALQTAGRALRYLLLPAAFAGLVVRVVARTAPRCQAARTGETPRLESNSRPPCQPPISSP